MATLSEQVEAKYQEICFKEIETVELAKLGMFDIYVNEIKKLGYMRQELGVLQGQLMNEVPVTTPGANDIEYSKFAPFKEE